MTPFSLLRCLGAQQGYTREQNLQHTQELCPAGLSTGSNAHADFLKKKKKLFSWARGMQKCLGQRLAVNTYKFLSHPWGYDPLNSLCVLPVRSLPWHIPVSPWKAGVCWGQSWGWCEQQSRGDEKYLRVATVQFPENSVEKVSFPLDKIYEDLLVQRQPPAQSLAGAIEVSPCSWERQGKQRATLP